MVLKTSNGLTPSQEVVPGLMHRAVIQARPYAPTNPPLDEGALVFRSMGFYSEPLAGKGKLGAQAMLATCEAECGTLVAKPQEFKNQST